MKAISSIIAVVLILLIVTALTGLLGVFFFGLIPTLAGTAETTLNKTTTALSSCMWIDSIYETNIYIRNCGEGAITNDTLAVYIDDDTFNFTMNPASVGEEEVGTITLYDLWKISLGDHDLKITNPYTQVFKRVEAVLPDSCVLALDFDEGSETIAKDSSPYENDGTINGATVVEGKFGSALEFDALDDYVEIPDDDSLDFDLTDSFTIEMWVKANNIPTGSDIGMIFQKYPGGAPDIRIYVRYGMFSGYIRDNSPPPDDYVYVFSIGPEINRWYHLALVRDVDEDNLFLYVNGSLYYGSSVNDDTTTLPLINTESIKLGAHKSSGVIYPTWNGTIDEVRIYNKALTLDETVILKMK